MFAFSPTLFWEIGSFHEVVDYPLENCFVSFFRTARTGIPSFSWFGFSPLLLGLSASFQSLLFLSTLSLFLYSHPQSHTKLLRPPLNTTLFKAFITWGACSDLTSPKTRNSASNQYDQSGFVPFFRLGIYQIYNLICIKSICFSQIQE